MKKVILFCLLLTFGVQACMDAEDPNQDVKDLKEQQDVQISRHLKDNQINAEKDNMGAYVLPLVENPSGTTIEAGNVVELVYNITQLDGTPIGSNAGDSMRVAYDGKSMFYPSYLYFSLAHMKEGEKYRFYLPFDLAYGNFEMAGTVPFRSIVVMEVEVKDVYKTGEELKTAEIQMIERVVAQRGQDADTLSPSGVRKVLLEEGEGEEVDANDQVSVYYTGTYLNGKEFDSNTGASDSKFTFAIGGGETISGFETAVKSMKKGEKAVFYLPSSEAYGKGKGAVFAAPESIREGLSKMRELLQYVGLREIIMPPHSPLVFEIELVEVVKKE